tara:strand:+ start:691 stop:864 length:174 start_codon:yes stop_codon:yes gene_type:complete
MPDHYNEKHHPVPTHPSVAPPPPVGNEREANEQPLPGTGSRYNKDGSKKELGVGWGD